jgi:hypothetical protein
MPKVVFSCCYCGRNIDEETPDRTGVSLYNMETGEPGQSWFAHEFCFRQKLHPDYDISMNALDDDADWEVEP